MVRWPLDPLSAVFPKASAMPWADITSHLWEGICLVRDLLELSFSHCNSHCMLSPDYISANTTLTESFKLLESTFPHC